MGAKTNNYLPLILGRVNGVKESFRVTFRLFPRDLVVELGRNRSDQGIKFVPPYALHTGAENHNVYSKLLITLSQRFREDEKPEEDKLKSEKLVALVPLRINQQKDKFTDEKVKAPFQKRSEARKIREEGGSKREVGGGRPTALPDQTRPLTVRLPRQRACVGGACCCRWSCSDSPGIHRAGSGSCALP